MSRLTLEKHLDSSSFRTAFRRHPAAVAVVTLFGESGPVGFTATSVISVSADPPVIAFSMIGTSSSWPAMSKADTVVIHLLSASDTALSKRFATSGIDRFEGLDWAPLSSGEPVISGVDTWIRCSVLRRDAAGSSIIIQVQPTDGHVNGDRSPLLYHDRRYHRLSDASAISE
jgi:flavin reductase (DIM6/NTAB) family NADH-FMN oxidoreductase RutF